ncbi:MAG: cell division protein FtsZ [Muribaculaceae bacterium]|nr:cell division protein FtsZ [Muribaculaceae bacterium]
MENTENIGNDSTIGFGNAQTPIVEQQNIFDKIEDDPGFKKESGPKNVPNLIKVIGIGGGGNNAINHMFEQNINGVSFVVMNTDRQALNNSPVPNRVLIGPNTTFGLGAGNKPELAKEAAEESEQDIASLFDDETKMVFITAGMGGGTGTGAAPVVARIAREKGVLTIGIVTIPFLFEGKKKIIKALSGADEMQKYVDALLIINNERLSEIYPDLNFMNAFGKADDTLSIAARSISELITVDGYINLDFNDVNTTLRKGGVAIISSGYGEGEQRVTKAIQDALNSPLLKNRDVYGSEKILMNFYFSSKAKNEFKMSEIDEMRRFMTQFTHEVDVIWGVAYDDTLGEKVKITMLAAGFNVSLDAEAAIAEGDKKSESKAATSTSSRIELEYGDKFNDLDLERAQAQYIVLRPEDIDNDEIVDLLEKNPAFKRDQQVKNVFRELQNAPSKPAAPKPISPLAKKKPSSTTATISFND